MNIGSASRQGWFDEEAPNNPGSSPWFVICDNGFTSVVWLPNDTDPADVSVLVDDGVAVDPLLLAAELLENIPIPEFTIGVNPEQGLVALASWFWVEGYDGAAIGESATLEDVTVEVEITPTGYAWRFGDGGELVTTSLGQPYPQESDIRHTYERSSLAVAGAYAVTVEVTFDVRFRVDGGAWESLAPIARSFTVEYPVQQLQSILTGS